MKKDEKEENLSQSEPKIEKDENKTNTGDLWTYMKQIEELEKLLRKRDEHIASQDRAMKKLNE